MLSYKKLHKVVLKVSKGDVFNFIKNKYLLGYIEETDLGTNMELKLQTDSLEVLGRQLMEYMLSIDSNIEIIEPEELKCITRKYLAQITEHCMKLTIY